MFFQPRIGQHYQEGFRGYKTLVLGAKHHCILKQCQFYDDCVTHRNCANYDTKCPAYGDRHDLRLSQSNQIEIDSFLEEYDRYPTYSYFTKLMLNKAGDLSEEEKCQFWERMAFANYLQYFCPSPQVPEYKEKGSFYRTEDWKAFLELLETVQPEVLLVWNSALKTLLDSKMAAGEIVGLTHFDDFRSETLTINRYLYKVQPKKSPEESFADFHLGFCPEKDKATVTRVMLNALQKARFRQFVPPAEMGVTQPMIDAVSWHVWDKALSCHLVGMLQAEMGWNSVVSAFEPEIKNCVCGHRAASNFLLEGLETAAIGSFDCEECSWFDLGRTMPANDVDVVVLCLTNVNDAFKSLLARLGNTNLRTLLVVVRKAASDKLLPFVTVCAGLCHIVEKGETLLMEFGAEPHEKVGLVHGASKQYLRRSNLQRGQSLCPSDYLSVSMSGSELKELIYRVFRKQKVVVQTAKGERDLDELLGGLLDKDFVRRSGKRLKSKKGCAGQLLFYGLHCSGLSWSDIEALFADGSVAKNANPKKVAKLLETDTPSVRYYRNLFGF